MFHDPKRELRALCEKLLALYEAAVAPSKTSKKAKADLELEIEALRKEILTAAGDFQIGVSAVVGKHRGVAKGTLVSMADEAKAAAEEAKEAVAVAKRAEVRAREQAKAAEAAVKKADG